MELTDAEINQLYKRYAPALYHRCRRILRNDDLAHDAVQETFVRVVQNSTTFRQQSSALTWLYKISTNLCLNQIRNHKSREQKRDKFHGDLKPAGDDAMHSLDYERALALLEGMDEQTKRVVIYTYFDDCTRKEVAELVGISIPTVRSRISQFLEVARSKLTPLAVLFGVFSWMN